MSEGCPNRVSLMFVGAGFEISTCFTSVACHTLQEFYIVNLGICCGVGSIFIFDYIPDFLGGGGKVLCVGDNYFVLKFLLIHC